VDLNARQLHVVRGGARVATHPVAVGSTEWPTQTGEWKIVQAVWNPEWTPPDESWAEEREPRKPGDPKNPLGRIQLVYDPPRSIHGTNQPSSIGKAVSHGSIRVANDVGVQLAKMVMEAGGAAKDEAWYTQAQANRTEKQIVDLPQPIPIRVY
jgi:lipoprotein-anchoring transpeptidase ErfK/SrfK